MKKSRIFFVFAICFLFSISMLSSDFVRIKAKNEDTSGDVTSKDDSNTSTKETDRVHLSNPLAVTTTITDINDLKTYFPDDIFREVVFNALRDGKNGAVGSNIEEALYNFRGVIKHDLHSNSPDSEKIKNISGIQYLRNAKKISLKYNHIEDFSMLNKADKEYYGELLVKDPTIAEDARNIIWDFSGNPFSKLPENFGGRLEILQPGASSYTYSLSPDNTHIYMRSDTPIEIDEIGNINIHKVDIYGTLGIIRAAKVVESYTKIETAVPGDHGPLFIKIKSFDDNVANYTFKGTLEKSENYYVYVGLDEELKYTTNDEFAGLTDGKQSFKYYIPTAYVVYDRIETSTVRGDHARMTKTDKDTGKPVQNAVYNLYQINADSSETLIMENLMTDEKGQLSTPGLFLGNYYLKEVQAPVGYSINDEKITFEITKNADQSKGVPRIILQGGEDSITTSDGVTINADASKREKLFAGGMEQDNKTTRSIDFTYKTENVGVDDILRQVVVSYDQLGNSKGTTTRSFATIDEAIADINNEKNTNNIRGSVKIKGDYMVHDSKTIDITTMDTAIPYIDIQVEKKWVDHDSAKVHPDVTISLLQNGKKVKEHILKNTESKFVFDNLIAVDDLGKAYTYAIEEVAVDGYDSDIKGTAKDGFVITNTAHLIKKIPNNNKGVETKDTTQITTYGILFVSAIGVLVLLKKKKHANE